MYEKGVKTASTHAWKGSTIGGKERRRGGGEERRKERRRKEGEEGRREKGREGKLMAELKHTAHSKERKSI